MTTSIESVLISTIQETKDGLGKGVEWALKQTPELCEQYLRYELVLHAVSALVLWGIGAVCLHLMHKFLKWFKAERTFDTTPEVIMMVFPAVAVGAVLIAAFCNTAAVLKIAIAPKVYLVEFASKIINP